MLYNKLKKLKDNDVIRIVYQCKECGYMVNKPVIKEEVNFYLDNLDKYTLFICHNCSEQTMELIEIWSEEEWNKEYKYAD